MLIQPRPKNPRQIKIISKFIISYFLPDFFLNFELYFIFYYEYGFNVVEELIGRNCSLM